MTAVLASLVLSHPAIALAQTEATLTRGECGATVAAARLDPPDGTSSEDGIVLSRTRLSLGLDEAMSQGLTISLTNNGSLVACGPIPDSSEQIGRVEVEVLPTTGTRPYGFAILREINAGKTMVLLAVSGLGGPTATSESGRTSGQQTSGFSAAEQAYFNSVTQISSDVSVSIDAFQELAASPRFSDEDWLIGMAAVAVAWQFSYEDVQQLDPPSSLSEVHANITEALRLLSSAGDDFLLGIDTVDPALIEQGSAKIAEGTGYLDTALRLLSELATARGE